MSRRSNTFVAPRFEPFKDHPNFELKDEHVTGPVGFFNPTHARFDYTGAETDANKQPSSSTPQRQQFAKNIQYKWRSRDNRKGRHTILVDPTKDPFEAKFLTPEFTTSVSQVLAGIKRMFTYFPVWDVSYLVAQCFVWGSAIFVANGLFYWLPLLAPSTAFDGEEEIAGGVTAFVGTIFFQVGVVLLMLEAVNTNRKGCFGYALREVFSDDSDSQEAESSGEKQLQVVPDHRHCRHHHPNRKSLFSIHFLHHHDSQPTPAQSDAVAPTKTTATDATASTVASAASLKLTAKGWVWWPSWHDLTTHYFHEIGFISSFIYFIAGTIFWIIGFTSLPNVEQNLSVGELYGVFWAPDLLGSLGFIIGSYFIMLETQPNWYTPAPKILGWHIGLWNLIGSIGFGLSAAFGTAYQAKGTSWLLWQSDCSTTWGSFCFLVAGVLQWYESLDKYVVEPLKKPA